MRAIYIGPFQTGWRDTNTFVSYGMTGEVDADEVRKNYFVFLVFTPHGFDNEKRKHWIIENKYLYFPKN